MRDAPMRTPCSRSAATAAAAAADAAPTANSKLASANPLARKLNRILHLSLDAPETQDAFAALSSFYPDNSPAARRNLKSDIEKSIIGANAAFLSAFDVVHEHIARIELQISAIGDRCAAMDDQLRAAYKDTASVLKHTQDIKSKRRVRPPCWMHSTHAARAADSRRSEIAAQRKLIADALLKRFALADDEIRALTTSGDSVDSSFFAALRHVHQIQDDCKALLTSENQRLGLDIMETTRLYQDAAFEKLFRWTLAECRLMKLESPEITLELKEGIRALKQRPIHFQACMDEISTIRHAAVIRSFQDALSIGGPGGFPRPIEMHAHDALRYVGDILAWAHQASVGEREMLEGLFGLASSAFRAKQSALSAAGNNTAASAAGPDAQIASPLDEIEGYRADEELLLQVLDKDLEGICRPLRQRIDSVLASGIGPITSYRIANLVQFYSQTVTKILGTFSQLSVALEELASLSFKVFFDTLNAQAADMLRFIQTPDADLQPPQALKDTITQLREIMLSYDGSLLSPEARAREFVQIISALMDPVIRMCELASTNLKPLESAIFMVNCLHHIQTALAAFSFASEQVQAIDAQMDAQVEVLVKEQFSVILVQSGLHALAQQMQANQPPLALARGCDAKAVSEALARMDMFLVTVTVDVAETLARISSGLIARRVAQRGFRRFVDAYGDIVARVLDPANKYEFPSSLITRTVDEVETLLSLQSDE
ncbi:Golgi transport complex subunit 6 [Polyrhizophydium stewartii]|uniref:Conserved oligomeric Golgi complex subunit 6 n=1 Tax=Polyrhizophydium stewartii TaxID=2732419 RepID=A0ABR4NKJ1_9FUNG